MSNLKVEGKVADFCPKCKNCKSASWECDGKKDWLTEVECEDPYDGMIRTLDADSDICCSMFKARSNPTHVCYEQEVKTVKPGEKVDIPEPSMVIMTKEEYDSLLNKIERLKKSNENLLEKCKGYIAENAELKLKLEKDKDFNTLVSDLYKQIQDLKSDNARLDKLYSERDGELKELIKASKRKDDLIQSYREKLKKANDENNLLNSKLDKLGEYYRTDEKLIDNIQKVIFPQEEGSDYTYSYEEILNKVKELKVQSDENGTMYEDLKYWKERCHEAETDVTTLNSKVEVLEKKLKKANDENNLLNSKNLDKCDEISKLKDAIDKIAYIMYGRHKPQKYDYEKLANDISMIHRSLDNERKRNEQISDLTESNENLKEAVKRRDKWIEDLKSDIDTLQNECLVIAEIAKRAYDDTNRD